MQDKFAFEINANGAFANEQKGEDELEFVSLPQLRPDIVSRYYLIPLKMPKYKATKRISMTCFYDHSTNIWNQRCGDKERMKSLNTKSYQNYNFYWRWNITFVSGWAEAVFWVPMYITILGNAKNADENRW